MRRRDAVWLRRAHLGDVTARAAELALAGIGLAYFVDDIARAPRLAYLGWFDLVAVAYLTIGFFVVRRSRKPGLGRRSASRPRGVSACAAGSASCSPWWPASPA